MTAPIPCTTCGGQLGPLEPTKTPGFYLRVCQQCGELHGVTKMAESPLSGLFINSGD